VDHLPGRRLRGPLLTGNRSIEHDQAAHLPRARPDRLSRLDEGELLALVAQNTGVPERLIRVATGYRAAYPDEIDAEIAVADAAEDNAEQAWRRERELLGG
jgi:hypothetical protein